MVPETRVMNFVLLTICCCSWAVVYVYGQTFDIGSCPIVPVKTDLDLNQYAGTWYENRKNRRLWVVMDSGLRCATETYTVQGNDTIIMSTKGQRILNGRVVTSSGVGQVQSPGKLAFTFKDLSFSPRDAPYWVLDTDYTSFSVVWSCSERARMNAQVAWILTREPHPDDATVKKAIAVLELNGLARSSLVPTLHNNCNYNKTTSR